MTPPKTKMSGATTGTKTKMSTVGKVAGGNPNTAKGNKK